MKRFSSYLIFSDKNNSGDNYGCKKILFALLISALLVGGVCAASVNDFKVDNTYKNIYKGEYYSVYANSNQDSGISIYKNVNDDVYDDMENDDVLDHVIQHDGREYLHSDDDFKIDVGSNHIGNFTDYDHATKGVSEVVKAGGEEFIVVVWSKDSINIGMNKLMSTLNDFNKNNNVSPVAF